MIPLQTTEDVRCMGQQLFFEYHCFESHSSSDAELWYRSHQSIIIIGFAPNDGWDIVSQEERNEGGTPIMYKIKFNDRFIGDAFEDELLDSEKEYCRPSPPKRKNKKGENR